MIALKRAYEPAAPEDGFRILVDRLWPRGVSKEKAALDLWFKDTAPSNELRKWFAHDSEKWQDFVKRYHAELAANPECLAQLRRLVREHKTVTLVYGARDETHNEAVVLKEYLERH